VVDVRMIDFEHSTYAGFLDDPVHDGVDTGYIFGLNNLIAIFNEVLAELTAVTN
jgi:inositol-hexakisphosphate kinase